MEVIGTDFENWGPYLMKQFQLMYEKGERCDLEISCNKQIFLVHRLIMSACSEYVKELGDKQHIILPEEVSCKALKMVLDFVYSGKIIFNKEEKDDLLLASNLLNMRLLTELIKMEESCSFTLSMDDEPDEKANENTNNIADSQETMDTDPVEPTNLPQTPSQVNYKKRSDTRNRPRSNKNSVLPPLHKFPYLQQKFSASRTYGLITTLTDPIPSRFEISDSMLLECSYRSAFEDVSYETERLCGDSDSFPVLEQQHVQFLKKMRESSNHKRSYSNALYSPFDKYTPPYTMNNENLSRKRESVSSYLSKPDPIPTKRSAPSPKTSNVPKYGNKNLKNAANLSSNVSTVNTISTAHITNTVNKINSVKTSTTNTVNSTNTSNTGNAVKSNTLVDKATEEPVKESYCGPKTAAETTTLSSEVNVPEKSPEIIEVPSIENGEKVELIKLNNAVIPNVEDDFKARASEEVPDVSISVIPPEKSAEEIQMKEDISENAIPEETTFTADTNIPSITDISVAGESTAAACFGSSETNLISSNEPTSILPDDGPDNDSDTDPVSILPDNSLFTSLDTSNMDLSTDSNSQIFALKAKGTENPAQLSKLVEDLCKKSPLLKNKNVRFKIVPVKGPIPDILKDQARVNSSMLNKAIIVKKSDSIRKIEVNKDVWDKPNKKTENQKVPSIENVNGPWECKVCGDSENAMKFGSYFEYRTHLHEVHSEPNNPMFCVHCGYKSLKRNMQLYHLFIKHNVQPPSNFKFPKCDKCEFYALNEYYLQKHLTCHPSGGMEYVCSCKVAFKTSEALQKHIVSGDCKNSKSFTCGYCRCMFDRFVNLKAHMRVCMKERSKPILQSNDNIPEHNAKTISDGGKDYLAL